MKKLNIKKSSLFLYLLFIIASFTQCRKNVDETIITPKPSVQVQADLFGVVTDDQGKAIQSVKVMLGDKTVTTDELGVFYFHNQLMDQNGEQVSFEKSAYFTCYKTFLPIKGKVNNIRMQLISKKLNKTISSNVANTIKTNGNASIDFSANGFMDANGKIYNGDVNVYTHYLDPSLEQTFREMPGDLTGRQTNGKEVLLRTFGMIAVELEDPQGRPLQLLTGKTARIKLPIPTSMLPQAKPSIPTWSYDSKTKAWKEEGQATLINNEFVFDAPHFSFWNCDYPVDYVTLSGKIVDENGKGLGNTLIKLSVLSNNQIGYGITTAEGYFSGKIFANEQYKMEIYNVQKCILQAKNFASGAVDLNLGDIKINENFVSKLIIRGRILDCSQNISTHAFITVTIDDIPYSSFTDQQGNFELSTYFCSNQLLHELKYMVYDYIGLKQSKLISSTISNLNLIELGDLKACDEEIDLVNINFRNKSGKLLYATEIAGRDTPIVYGVSAHGFGFGFDSISFRIVFYDFPVQIGIQNNYSFHCGFGSLISPPSILFDCYNCPQLTLNITHFGKIGEKIKGNFSGSLINNNKPNDPPEIISGDFSLTRKI